MNLDIGRLGSLMVLEEPRYECAACRDSGWRRVANGDRVTKCECRLPRNNPAIIRASMELAGMEADEIRSAFTPWDTSHQERPSFAREWLFSTLSGGNEGVRNPWCLGLLGLPGRGKSKTAAVCVRLFIESGGSNPLWVRVPEGFDRIQDERRSDAYLEEGALEKKIERSGLCVLDDFGIAHRSNPDLMEETVNEWLARRHRRHLLTIITANAEDPSGLGAPRIESRIAEGVYRTMTADTDYRDQP